MGGEVFSLLELAAVELEASQMGLVAGLLGLVEDVLAYYGPYKRGRGEQTDGRELE